MNVVFQEFKNAFRYRNNILINLIFINIIVFLVLSLAYLIISLSTSGATNPGELHQKWIMKYVATTANLSALMYRPWTILTYAFVHLEIWHILFNMIALYFFGRIVSDLLGDKRLVSLYILGGLVGALFYISIYNAVPGLNINSRMIGASGAVYALITAASTLSPNTIFMIFGVFPIRLVYLAWACILFSFIELFQYNTGGNAAHLGGALIGYVFVVQLRKGRDLGKPIQNFAGWLSGFFSRKPRMKVKYIKPEKVKTNSGKFAQGFGGNADVGSAVPNQDEIDKILDKISEKGYNSLSKEEKQKLFDASRR